MKNLIIIKLGEYENEHNASLLFTVYTDAKKYSNEFFAKSFREVFLRSVDYYYASCNDIEKCCKKYKLKAKLNYCPTCGKKLHIDMNNLYRSIYYDLFKTTIVEISHELYESLEHNGWHIGTREEKYDRVVILSGKWDFLEI